MGVELSMDNILSNEDVDTLFTDEQEDSSTIDNKESENNKEEENKETTEVDVENLFDEKSESVGSEENTEEKEDTKSNEDKASPDYNFYSSIAKALKDEGVFPNPDDETISKVTTPEAFKELIEQQIREGLDERQKRIDAALGVGIEPDEITKYENTISYLDSLSDKDLSDDSDNGENLRKRLIYQDFVNRGYSDERAKREIQKSFNAGTDIEDAKEALKSNKEFFKGHYDKLIEDAKAEEAKEEESRKQQAVTLKKSILEDKKIFGDLEVDKATRQKIFENISKPVYKNPSTGEYLTAIQKYELENKTDFLKNVSLIYTLTNGFKDIDGLIKNKVRKSVKSSIAELEKTINHSSRTSDGNLKFMTGVHDDPEAFASKWDIDI